MRQRLGQHFLQNASFLTKIASALHVEKNDVIFEIGPGHGELTDAILSSFAGKRISLCSLTLIEKDPLLVSMLHEKYKEEPRVSIIEADVREVLSTLPFMREGGPYKIAGNIPYYLTGFLIRIISELEHRPDTIVLTIQKEVALRICASAPDMNLLAASVQLWAKPELIAVIPRSVFSPPPEVDSAVIRLTPLESDDRKNFSLYIQAAKALFRQPRKTVLNNAAAATSFGKEELEALLRSRDIDPSVRPQNLSPDDIKKAAILLFPSI